MSRHIKTDTICFVCKKVIKDGEKYYMAAIEYPYRNMFMHYDCWVFIGKDIKKFIEETKKEKKNV